MNKKMSKTICLAATALVLTMGLAVNTAMAYFTTYATAKGGVTLELDFSEVKINEDVVNQKKQIVLENTGDVDCYVRVKALAGNAHITDRELSIDPGEEGPRHQLNELTCGDPGCFITNYCR